MKNNLSFISKTITAAETAVATIPFWIDGDVLSILLTGELVYGSGGTSVNVWVQTSIDDGVSWIDIANFSWTTASAKKACNLSSLTAVATQFAPTDGTLTANTCKDGVLGTLFRVKYTTVGTYAGGTILSVNASFKCASAA